MTDPRVESPVLRSADELTYFGITGHGTLQARELYRFMEHTGPQWWLPMSGMTREEFWRARRHALVARSTVVRIMAGGCRPSDPVSVEHAITHGRRERRGRGDAEYGFVDVLSVRRDSDGAVLADLATHTVWVDFRGGGRKVAAAPPGGLACPLEELPPLAPFPQLGGPAAVAEFTWTAREAEVTNSHVSFPSYAERAENALFDAGLPMPELPRWQGWYRLDFLTGDRTGVKVCRDGDGYLFGFCPADDHRPRVCLRLSNAGA